MSVVGFVRKAHMDTDYSDLQQEINNLKKKEALLEESLQRSREIMKMFVGLEEENQELRKTVGIS